MTNDPQTDAAIAIEIELALTGRTVGERAYHLERAMALADMARGDYLRLARQESAPSKSAPSDCEPATT